MQRSRSLRTVWLERHWRGLEPVLAEINEMLARGEVDVEEWVSVQRSDPVGAAASEGGEEKFQDWSPASVFGGAKKFEQGEIISEPHWMPQVVERVEQLLRQGTDDMTNMMIDLELRYGSSVQQYRDEICVITDKIRRLLDSDEEYLEQEAERTRRKAVQGYAAQTIQQQWMRYKFRHMLSNSPFSKLRWAVQMIQAKFKGKLAIRRAVRAKRTNAALVVQSWFRQYRERQYQIGIKSVYAARLQRLAETVYAKRIQKCFRSYRRRQHRLQCEKAIAPLIEKRLKELQRYTRCVVVVQRSWRRVVHLLHQKKKAALLIQQYWRRHSAVRKAGLSAHAATVIQTAARKLLALTRFAKVLRVVIFVQCRYRVGKARCLTCRMRRDNYLQRERQRLAQKHTATVFIQSVVRRNFACHRFAKVRRSVIRCQAIVRMHLAVKRAEQKRQAKTRITTAVRSIQAVARSCIARKAFALLKQKQLEEKRRKRRSDEEQQAKERERKEATYRLEKERQERDNQSVTSKPDKQKGVSLASPESPFEQFESTLGNAKNELNSGRLYGKRGSAVGNNQLSAKAGLRFPPILNASNHRDEPKLASHSSNQVHERTQFPLNPERAGSVIRGNVRKVPPIVWNKAHRPLQGKTGSNNELSARATSRSERSTSRSEQLSARFENKSFKKRPSLQPVKVAPLRTDNYRWGYKNQIRELHRKKQKFHQSDGIDTKDKSILDKLGYKKRDPDFDERWEKKRNYPSSMQNQQKLQRARTNRSRGKSNGLPQLSIGIKPQY